MKQLTLSVVSVLAMALVVPAQGSTRGVVVSGIGGNVEYENAFEQQAQDILSGLQTLNPDEGAFTLLAGPEASRDKLLSAISAQADSKPQTFVLVLLGHGAVDGRNWRFNIPGDDFSDEDLVAALAGVESSNQLLVAATSASGALLDKVSQPGRVVVTATKSGGEINVTRFGEFFAQAINSDVADLDRNEILTIGEAWRYANEKVVEYYEDKKLLASEHARINVNGQADLPVARLGALRLAAGNSEVAGLLDKRLTLEKQFNALKAEKSNLAVEEFYHKLEPVLMDIAKLQKQIDSATGWEASNE